jgi:hypothetical protein
MRKAYSISRLVDVLDLLGPVLVFLVVLWAYVMTEDIEC